MSIKWDRNGPTRDGMSTFFSADGLAPFEAPRRKQNKRERAAAMSNEEWWAKRKDKPKGKHGTTSKKKKHPFTRVEARARFIAP